jgi:hypothetical protein
VFIVCSACNYIIHEHCKTPVTKHYASTGIYNSLTAHFKKQIHETVWPIGGFRMLSNILTSAGHANIWNELTIKTLYDYSRSEMVLRDGDIKRLMEFAIVGEEAIDKSAEREMRVNGIVQDHDKCISEALVKTCIIALQQYCKHNWNSEATLKTCESLVIKW